MELQFPFPYHDARAPSGPRVPLYWGLMITHNDASQSVGLLRTSDQPDAETSTWQHTTLTTHKHPCRRWDSNPQSQQASGHRKPTHYTARPPGPAPLQLHMYSNEVYGIAAINKYKIKLGTWQLDSNFQIIFYVLFVLCRSVYCLCVNVYCTTATGWQHN